MKFLLDENLPAKLKSLVSKNYENISHLADFDLLGKGDMEVWEFAKNSDFTIITKDKDFQIMGTHFGHPPKVIILKIGNCNIELLKEILDQNFDLFEEFETSEQDSVLVIHGS